MSLLDGFNRILSKLKRDPAVAAAKPLNARKALGNLGEEFALKLLKQRGHKFVARNVLFKCGELDLVTWHGKTLVFTEVRTRSGTSFGTPAESVSLEKQERVRRAAHSFLARAFKSGQLPDCRFDVVWILAKDGKIVDSGVIEGAF